MWYLLVFTFHCDISHQFFHSLLQEMKPTPEVWFSLRLLALNYGNFLDLLSFYFLFFILKSCIGKFILIFLGEFRCRSHLDDHVSVLFFYFFFSTGTYENNLQITKIKPTNMYQLSVTLIPRPMKL